MKRLFLLLAVVGMLFTACSDSKSAKPTSPSDNEIWYTTTDGKPLVLSNCNLSQFNVKDKDGNKSRGVNVSFISNTYSNGRGVLKFSKWAVSDFIKCGIFRNQSTLESVILPNSLECIEADAFYGCSSLTSITIGNSVTDISDQAFYGCSSLTSINIPESVTWIGDYAFNDCSNLININIPESVKKIENYAFNGCSSLTSINIPKSVTNIGEYAFNGCSSLTSINLPENETLRIGAFAFKGCSSLTSIIIPENVIAEEHAFRGCSLTSITFLDLRPYLFFHRLGIPSTTTIYVPKEAVEAYMNASVNREQIKPIE